MSIKIALAGNPNCGKTTVFNPKSGKGLIKEHLVNIVDIMTKAGYKIPNPTIKNKNA